MPASFSTSDARALRHRPGSEAGRGCDPRAQWHPVGIRNVLIESGCSDVDTMDEDVLPLDNSSFHIVFEPLLDKYVTSTPRSLRAATRASTAPTW
jgi:hypothetical protein